MSYYEGGRRFALGGKGWTIVLGTVVSLSYIRAKDKLEHNDLEQAHHTLLDKKGNPVAFADQPHVPGKKEDVVLRLWRQLPDVPLPNLYIVGGVLTGIWAYRMWGSFNRLMIIRFSDINYQVRRPDVLANKVIALKYLALPLAAVPLLCFGTYGLMSLATRGSDLEAEEGNFISATLRRQAAALRDSFEGPVREAKRLAHDAIDPMASDLSSGPLATFARRSQTVGIVNLPKPTDVPVRPPSGGSFF
eukprot:TRINITY_DN23952_c0_g1_i1.p1 TRINITY_DN23952_c0_g1~~TRINITY_DN23952_c0_g1_i1.p1  ORF type:complete len:247 (+),score=34.82 TRINITY_DN23952_c0_g1_i1:55-795(+)